MAAHRKDISDEHIREIAHLNHFEAAVALGVSPSTIHARRVKLGLAGHRFLRAPISEKTRAHIEVADGIVIVAGDNHYWPGPTSTAHRALCHFAAKLQPAAIVIDGDAMDGARISRWPAGSWFEASARPTVTEEIGEVQVRLKELAACAPKADKLWTMGNHDARFERYLLDNAPELTGVPGARLKDHFPAWKPCWSVWINPEADIPAVVKHRWKGGRNAPRNNTIEAGTHFITGHFHSMQVMPFSDYRGTRWGVDAGTIAVPYDRQFVHYTEDNPVDWRSGFAVLTFEGGRLLWPEVVFVVSEADGVVSFRGKTVEV